MQLWQRRAGFLVGLFWLVAATAEPPGEQLTEQLVVPGGYFTVHWQEPFTAKEKKRLRQWLSETAKAASLIGGAFPRQHTHIFLHRSTSGKGPVPWAHTMRATNPEGVVFHVNPRQRPRQFISDWTATHEFSHLYLPYVGRDDAWLAEGFASYYQFILMMRHGILSELAGWQKFREGLARGEDDPYQQGPLHLASQQMREKRAFKRVYWSGALYFLEVDLALRGQGSSLDEVISAFQMCCRDQPGPWTGKRLVAQLDQAGQTALFSEKYRSFAAASGFPDYGPLLEEIGIVPKGKGIRFTEDATQTALRRSISQVQQTTRAP